MDALSGSEDSARDLNSDRCGREGLRGAVLGEGAGFEGDPVREICKGRVVEVPGADEGT